jgi:hypothetical protein
MERWDAYAQRVLEKNRKSKNVTKLAVISLYSQEMFYDSECKKRQMVLQTENLDNKFRFKSSFITFAIVVFIHERCLSLSALSPQLQLY